MNISNKSWLPSLAAIFMLAGAVAAQSSTGSQERHDVSSLGMPPDERSAQAILAAKLGKAQPIKDLDQLEQLARQLKNSDISPEQLEQMARLAKDLKPRDLTEEQKARFQKDLQDIVKDLKKRPELPQEKLDQLEQQLGSVGSGSSAPEAGSGSGSPIHQHAPPDVFPPVPPPDNASPPQNHEVEIPPVRHSLPRRDDIRRSGDLTSKLGEQLFGKGGLLSRTKLNKLLGGLTRSGRADAGGGEGSHLPELYQLLHSGHGSGESSNSPSSLLGGAGIPRIGGNAPEPSEGSADRGGGLGAFALVVVSVLVLGAGLYWVMRLWKKGDDQAAAAGWRLGPWPVNPAQVSTSEQLIRAFEYLAVLLLGRGARHRNHRQIAAGLKATAGAEGMAKRDAAEELTAIYEQARYAPLTEPLDGNQLAAARRDLILLAGHSAH
jgi:hypothetical protein